MSMLYLSDIVHRESKVDVSFLLTIYAYGFAKGFQYIIRVNLPPLCRYTYIYHYSRQDNAKTIATDILKETMKPGFSQDLDMSLSRCPQEFKIGQDLL
jgi:hypothetical protein